LSNGRFLGWLKGYIHDRNNSSANLVNGYARATLTRRAPDSIRRALVARYAFNDLSLAPSSFLHDAGDRLARRHRPGQHYVDFKLSRRNNKKVSNPEQAERKLWQFLKTYVVDERRAPLLRQPASDVHTIEILSKGRTAVVVNGQPVRVGAWFQYESVQKYVGKLERIFAVTFGNTAACEVIAYIRRFAVTAARDDTDFDVDTDSYSSLDVVPLKSLSMLLWEVPRWDYSDPKRHVIRSDSATKLRLLLVKEL
jgi:hypothetical protein